MANWETDGKFSLSLGLYGAGMRRGKAPEEARSGSLHDSGNS